MDRVYLLLINYKISNISTVLILQAYNIDINYQSKQSHLSNLPPKFPLVRDLKQFVILFFY